MHLIQLRHKAPAMRMDKANDGDLGALMVGGLRVADGMETEKQQSDGKETESSAYTDHSYFPSADVASPVASLSQVLKTACLSAG